MRYRPGRARVRGAGVPLVSGQADDWTWDNTFTARPDVTLPFTTRVLVQQQADPAAFSGAVYLEPNHPDYDRSLTWWRSRRRPGWSGRATRTWASPAGHPAPTWPAGTGQVRDAADRPLQPALGHRGADRRGARGGHHPAAWRLPGTPPGAVRLVDERDVLPHLPRRGVPPALPGEQQAVDRRLCRLHLIRQARLRQPARRNPATHRRPRAGPSARTGSPSSSC